MLAVKRGNIYSFTSSAVGMGSSLLFAGSRRARALRAQTIFHVTFCSKIALFLMFLKSRLVGLDAGCGFLRANQSAGQNESFRARA